MTKEVRGVPSLWMQAANLAAAGRNGDSMLVHMTPNEVETLSRLSPGGAPTINPHTGLPEFWGLEDLFSSVGEWFGGGSSEITPSVYDDYVLDYDAPGGPGDYNLDGGFYSVDVPGETNLPVSYGEEGGIKDGLVSDDFLQRLSNSTVDEFGKNATGSASPGVFDQVSDFFQNNRALSTVALIAGLAGIQMYERQQQQKANEAAGRRSVFRTSYNDSDTYRAYPGLEFDPRPTRRTITPPPAGYNPLRDGGHNFYSSPSGAIPQRYAEGGEVGIKALTTGAIRGPGAGMEDKIHGTIDGRREVRLSDGEHVIPADVVSSLGDGSSKAGHERLSQMIHRVRAEKTGSTRQPPPIDPNRVMPR